MQITDLLILGLAAFVAADCDENDDNSNDCSSSSSSVVVSTTVAASASTTTDVNGVVITNLISSTDIDRSTSLVPVLTQDVSTSTDVDVNTSRNTIAETTDIGTTPTNTIVQVATTTDVGLEGGYAYTTNSNGSTIATYTGTDDSQPRTSSITTSTVAAGSTGGAAAGNSNDGDDADTTGSQTSSDSFAMATAVPYIGAAAMAGLAFIV